MFGDHRFCFVFALILIFLFGRTSSECRQLTTCSCIFPNGHGYNLTSLIDKGVISAESNNYTFYFQPCKNTKLSNMTTSECNKPSSLCVQHNNESRILGTVEETKMEFHSDKNLPTLTLNHKLQNGSIITTMISLICWDALDTKLRINGSPNVTLNHLMLQSPFACDVVLRTSEGLSTFSILFILFLVFTGIYFIGGALALKFLRGATGWEMLPNHEFWCKLPSLIKDGVTALFSCCRGDSYERI